MYLYFPHKIFIAALSDKHTFLTIFYHKVQILKKINRFFFKKKSEKHKIWSNGMKKCLGKGSGAKCSPFSLHLEQGNLLVIMQKWHSREMQKSPNFHFCSDGLQPVGQSCTQDWSAKGRNIKFIQSSFHNPISPLSDQYMLLILKAHSESNESNLFRYELTTSAPNFYIAHLSKRQKWLNRSEKRVWRNSNAKVQGSFFKKI